MITYVCLTITAPVPRLGFTATVYKLDITAGFNCRSSLDFSWKKSCFAPAQYSSIYCGQLMPAASCVNVKVMSSCTET